jgi:hypothetical protein
MLIVKTTERQAQPLPKIGPWTDQIDELLLANEGKAARERSDRLPEPQRISDRHYGFANFKGVGIAKLNRCQIIS